MRLLRRVARPLDCCFKALRHQNVVACFGSVLRSEASAAAAGENELMFLQEYCADGTLLEQLRKPSGYTADQALRWVRDVARGMEYLHGSRIQIAHRDLKVCACEALARVRGTSARDARA